jgi:RimJ/RimL family protein N-acetyltransferase
VTVSLRPVDVAAGDVEAFFQHQDDAQAAAMVPYESKTRDAHREHWQRILANPSGHVRTIVVDGRVAGNVVSWRDGERRLIGYWLGREFWGRGVASTALGLFLGDVKERPLYAFVAAHNAGSIRVLEKNGFELAEEQPLVAPDGVEERLYLLR